MIQLGILILSIHTLRTTSSEVGKFWHVSDMHWDPTYDDWAGSCGGGQPVNRRGPYGDYACDAPWKLIESAVTAMKNFEPSPDFLIWTGDDTPHIYNDTILNQEVVFSIINNLTSALEESFPHHLVLSALGNHDWSPKNQLPGKPDPFYDMIASRWSSWLTMSNPDANETFRKGAFYVADIPRSNVRAVVLNTNLYYTSNNETTDIEDPAGQLKWLEEVLEKAKGNGKQVIILGHVPPGMFEKHRNKHWFYPEKNEAFLNILLQHSSTIGSVHFAHHHTDSFRVLYDSKGVPVVSMLLAPAVTPWETTLPGVIGGAGNNPSIRLVEYDRQTGAVIDLRQYYLNLTEANTERSSWRLEYAAKKYYGVKDFSTQSLHGIAQKLKSNATFFRKYYKTNGVMYDPSEICEGECQRIHYCAITQLSYPLYHKCMEELVNKAMSVGAPQKLLLAAVTLVTLLVRLA